MVPGQVQAFEVAADVALVASLASPVLACRQCFLRKLQPRALWCFGSRTLGNRWITVTRKSCNKLRFCLMKNMLKHGHGKKMLSTNFS